jgi:hypothetical protein
VATEIAIGIAVTAGTLFLVVKFLMPEKRAKERQATAKGSKSSQ